MAKLTANKPASGAPFFTPAQEPPSGTALEPSSAPTLFKPLTIRSVSLANRFVVSPMCMYSADDGHLTDWHLVHLGQFALNGAGLVIVEATAVQPNGRISPEDSGLWQDSQIGPLRRINDYIHSQGHKTAIQLAHAGRKASSLAPWINEATKRVLATEEEGGWPGNVVGPSAVPFDEKHAVPRELSVEEIKQLVRDFADAAVRAVKAGFDIIEIHGAHGYLITEFLSPLSNKRTDAYGGSFENRTRLLFEILQAVRSVIPATMPLFLRISGTEWMEHEPNPSWDIESSIRLAKLLPAVGVDLLDVSSGGNSSTSKIRLYPYYQVDIAAKIRAALKAENIGLLIGAVGFVREAEMARSIVEDEEGKPAQADVVIVARQFMKEPNWVQMVAGELGVPVARANQYHRAPLRKTPKL